MKYFCYTVNTLLTKHVWSRRLNNSLIDVFLWTSTLSRSIVTRKKYFLGEYTAIFTSRLDKNECLFALMNDRLSFSFKFLASGFIYQTTRILFLEMNCLSLNIVPWLPFVNFHFSWMNLHNYSVRQIKLQVPNHYSSFKFIYYSVRQIKLQVSNHYSSFKFIYYSVRRIKLRGWIELFGKTQACYHACQK